MPDINSLLQAMAYSAQLADGINTANKMKSVPGEREMNPLAAPFSHGGLPMELAGGAALDYGINRLENSRHWSQGSRNNLALAQFLAHLAGIMYTNHNSRMPSIPGLQIGIPVGRK